MPLVEINDLNSLIGKKNFFFEHFVKNMQKASEKLSTSCDYTTLNLLHILYHQKYDKIIRVDLSKQANTITPQEIIFYEN